MSGGPDLGAALGTRNAGGALAADQETLAEVYENQEWHGLHRAWEPSRTRPQWSNKDGSPSDSPDDTPLPYGWMWTAQWRVDTSSGRDEMGWEYASRMARLDSSREVRAQRWNDRARRRRWMRPMQSSEAAKRAAQERHALTVRQVQLGLQRLSNARTQLERMVDRQHGATVTNEQLQSFNSMAADLKGLLDKLEAEAMADVPAGAPPSPMVVTVRKLANDLRREESRFQEIERRLQKARGGGTDSTAAPRRASASSRGRPASAGSKTTYDPHAVSGGALQVRGGAPGTADAPMRDSQDGVFRTRQQILERLVPEDESVVNARIIEERHEEVLRVNQGIREVNEAFRDLQRLVQAQQADIDQITANVETTHAAVSSGLEQVVRAEQIQKSTPCVVS